MAIALPWGVDERMNPLQAGGYYPSDVRDSPPAPMRDFAAWSAGRRLPGRPEEGLYFPSIAENVGRGPATMGPGVAVPIAPPVVGRALPVAPTDYYPDIANNVGGSGPGGALSPEQHNEIFWAMRRAQGLDGGSGGPAPSPPGGDLGPGIPLAPSPNITSTDLPPNSVPRGGGGIDWSGLARGLSRMGPPLAGPPSSARFNVSTRPAFIYTNPVAAQQASADQAQRFGLQAQEQGAYQDYLSRLQADKGATDRAMEYAKSNQALQAAQLGALSTEGAANRASNERIAGITETIRQHRIEDQKWQENETAADRGDGIAATLNKDPNAHVDRRYVRLNPQTNKWESAFQHRTRPPAPNVGVPTGGPIPAPTVGVPGQATTAAQEGPAIPVGPPPEEPTPAPAVEPPLKWWQRFGVTSSGPYFQAYP